MAFSTKFFSTARSSIAATTLVFAVSATFADPVSDAALNECQTEHESFSDVLDCLPAAEGANRMIKLLEAEPELQPLNEVLLPWCTENNTTM